MCCRPTLVSRDCLLRLAPAVLPPVLFPNEPVTVCKYLRSCCVCRTARIADADRALSGQTHANMHPLLVQAPAIVLYDVSIGVVTSACSPSPAVLLDEARPNSSPRHVDSSADGLSMALNMTNNCARQQQQQHSTCSQRRQRVNPPEVPSTRCRCWRRWSRRGHTRRWSCNTRATTAAPRPYLWSSPPRRRQKGTHWQSCTPCGAPRSRAVPCAHGVLCSLPQGQVVDDITQTAASVYFLVAMTSVCRAHVTSCHGLHGPHRFATCSLLMGDDCMHRAATWAPCSAAPASST